MENGASQVALVIKNPPANAGDRRDVSSIPGSGRSPGEGNSYSLQYSYLENPVDRGAWQATVHRVTKNWTPVNGLSTHTHTSYWFRVPNVGNVGEVSYSRMPIS